MKKHLTYTIPEGMQCTLQEALRGPMQLTCRQVRSAKFRENGILVNGERSRVSRILQEGDRISVLLEDRHAFSDIHGIFRTDAPGNSAAQSDTITPGNSVASENSFVPEDFPVSEIPDPEVLYEDEDLLIVNKPAGICVHPSHGHHGDTLADQVLARCIRNNDIEIPRIIGRLDKDTSGLVLFARNKAAAQRLFQNDLVSKEYLALARGNVRPPSCENAAGNAAEKTIDKPEPFPISCPIARDPGHKGKMLADPEGLYAGKPACTHVQILGYDPDQDVTALSLKLETGRTHQIRVHLAFIGHPLAGDPLYGQALPETSQSLTETAQALPETSQALPETAYGSRKKTAPASFSRAALHCFRMEILQPFTGEKLLFEAPLPEDLSVFKSLFF